MSTVRFRDQIPGVLDRSSGEYQMEALSRPRRPFEEVHTPVDLQPSSEEPADALERMADSHLEFLWRMARRMGLSASDADDVTQDAFVVAATRLAHIAPGKERSFLLSVALNRARQVRQRGARSTELLDDFAAPASSAQDLELDDARARYLLDLALTTLDEDLRIVFALHELEEQTMAEIAAMLDLAPGTVASRLRRAREEFKKAVAKLTRNARFTEAT